MQPHAAASRTGKQPTLRCWASCNATSTEHLFVCTCASDCDVCCAFIHQRISFQTHFGARMACAISAPQPRRLSCRSNERSSVFQSSFSQPIRSTALRLLSPLPLRTIFIVSFRLIVASRSFSLVFLLLFVIMFVRTCCIFFLLHVVLADSVLLQTIAMHTACWIALV